jgi:regulator of ribonuclease activity A
MKTADLMDVFQEELQSCETQFINYGGQKIFRGPCETLQCSNDNVLLKNIFEKQTNGKILIVDGGASLQSALMGDVIAKNGLKNHWGGVIIYGAVRDTVTLKSMNFGIKALGRYAKGYTIMRKQRQNTWENQCVINQEK